jgi:hypothetical protein
MSCLEHCQPIRCFATLVKVDLETSKDFGQQCDRDSVGVHGPIEHVERSPNLGPLQPRCEFRSPRKHRRCQVIEALVILRSELNGAIICGRCLSFESIRRRQSTRVEVCDVP